MRKRGLFRRYIWSIRFVQDSLETEYKQTTKVCAFCAGIYVKKIGFGNHGIYTMYI